MDERPEETIDTDRATNASRDETLRRYYDERAPVYEEIYHRDDPVRQAELRELGEFIRDRLASFHVLEVACGTGYWSERAAPVVRRLTAVDASPEMLEIARSKGLSPGRVEFRKADAFALDRVPGRFEAALAVFWLSHVPKSRLPEFLGGLHARIGEGARVVMADNLYNDGLGGEIVRPEGSEDTFKIRALPDGSTHRIVKNYFEADDLRTLFHPWADELDVRTGRCYWWLSYRVGRAGRGDGG